MAAFGSSAGLVVVRRHGRRTQAVQDRPDRAGVSRDRAADRGMEGGASVGQRPSEALRDARDRQRAAIPEPDRLPGWGSGGVDRAAARRCERRRPRPLVRSVGRARKVFPHQVLRRYRAGSRCRTASEGSRRPRRRRRKAPSADDVVRFGFLDHEQLCAPRFRAIGSSRPPYSHSRGPGREPATRSRWWGKSAPPPSVKHVFSGIDTHPTRLDGCLRACAQVLSQAVLTRGGRHQAVPSSTSEFAGTRRHTPLLAASTAAPVTNDAS